MITMQIEVEVEETDGYAVWYNGRMLTLTEADQARAERLLAEKADEDKGERLNDERWHYEDYERTM